MGSMCTYDKDKGQGDQKKNNKYSFYFENDCPFELTTIKLSDLKGDLLVLFIDQQNLKDQLLKKKSYFEDSIESEKIFYAIKQHRKQRHHKKHFILGSKESLNQFGINYKMIGVVLLGKYSQNSEFFRRTLRLFFDSLKEKQICEKSKKDKEIDEKSKIEKEIDEKSKEIDEKSLIEKEIDEKSKKEKKKSKKEKEVLKRVHEIQSIVVAQFPPSLQVPTNVGLKALIDNLRNADKQVTQIRVRCDGQVSLRESRKYVESNRHRKIHY